MRLFITSALVSLFVTFLAGQQSNWIVTPGHNNGYSTLYLPDMSRPIMENDLHGGDVPRYDVFVIYNENSCRVDYKNETGIRHISGNIDPGYQFNFASIPQYAYISAVYDDDDDIDAEIVSPGPLNQITLNPNVPPEDLISLSRQPEPGHDFTLVIDHSILGRTCDLEFPVNICLNFSQSEIISNVQPLNVFNGDYFLYCSGDLSYSGNSVCINNYNVEPGRYGFVNFHLSRGLDKTYYETEMNVTVNAKNTVQGGSCFNNPVLDEEIRDPRDPNEIEVLCVSDENGGQVTYAIRCYNDQPLENVRNLKFNIEFPESVDATNIVPLGLKLSQGAIDECMIEDIVASVPISGNVINFSFNYPQPHLDDFTGEPMKTNHAELIVCMPIIQPEGFAGRLEDYLSTVDLRPLSAETTFDNIPFVIENFVDTCSRKGVENETVWFTNRLECQWENHLGSENPCRRVVSNTCDCSVQCCTFLCKYKWPLIIGGVFLTLGIIALLRRP